MSDNPWQTPQSTGQSQDQTGIPVTKQAIRPSRAWFIVAALVFVAGIAAAVAIGVKSAGKLGDIAPKFQRMLAPGQAEMKFDKAGKYTIYREYRSTFEGKIYSNESDLTGLTIKAVNKATGEIISLEPGGMSETYNLNGCRGESLMRFQVDAPADVTVTAVYDGDGEADKPKAVLAVGQLNLGGVFGMIGGIFAAVGIALGGMLVSAGIVVITIIMRGRVKRRLWVASAMPQNPPPTTPAI